MYILHCYNLFVVCFLKNDHKILKLKIMVEVLET